MNKLIVRSALAALALASGVSASAASLVTNGGFEVLTNGPNLGSRYTDAVGWSITSPGGQYDNGAGAKGYSIFFAAGAADTIGATDNNPINTGIWGPGNGENNGFTSQSPTGGNYFATDSDPMYASRISQTITGLTVGKTYTLKFDWAGSQLYCAPCGVGQFQGATAHSFLVNFGAQSQSTAVVPIASHGFSGWMSEKMYFTASSGTQVLSFLSGSGPAGLPPMALLDSVSLTVPEPASWALMLFGFGAMGFSARRRRSVNVTA